jgi:hypothetical protein
VISGSDSESDNAFSVLTVDDQNVPIPNPNPKPKKSVPIFLREWRHLRGRSCLLEVDHIWQVKV